MRLVGIKEEMLRQLHNNTRSGTFTAYVDIDPDTKSTASSIDQISEMIENVRKMTAEEQQLFITNYEQTNNMDTNSNQNEKTGEVNSDQVKHNDDVAS